MLHVETPVDQQLLDYHIQSISHVHLMKQILEEECKKENKYFIDVGAAYGFFSLYAGSLGGPIKKFHFIQPNLLFFLNRMQSNIDGN